MTKSTYVSFGGYTCRIDFQSNEIEGLLNFLFGNMQGGPGDSDRQSAHYEIQMGPDDNWYLHLDRNFVGKYCDVNTLGNFLSGDVLFNLIEPNENHLAIHAGLVSQEKGCLLLPAESGSGKTSVTAWLILQGWQYHTDELVLIDLHGEDNLAFSRPLNIKSKGLAAIQELLQLNDQQLQSAGMRQADGITMMHPSMFSQSVNNFAKQNIPPIKSIVFPHFTTSGEPSLTPLTPAVAGLELMRSNVIARNLPGHGFSDIVSVVKKTPAYHLHYRHFNDLEALFEQVIISW